MTPFGFGEVSAWLIVPLYIALWQGLRWAQLAYHTKLRLRAYLVAMGASLPFWVASVIWSRKIYQALPATSSDCFVATAAMNGHEKLVGPLLIAERHGRLRPASQQMITLWQFEDFWRTKSGHSHALFRRCYNHIGPPIARRITSPFLSNAVYFLLKPAEWLSTQTERNRLAGF